MQFLEYYSAWITELRFKKQTEILKKIKKEIVSSGENLTKIEKPKIITDVKLIEDGSVRLYLSDAEQPVRFFSDNTTVNIVAIYKRLFVLLIKSLEKQNWLQRIITALAIKFNFKMLPEWFEMIYNNNYVLLKEKHWSQPIKEIRRVLKGRLDQRLVDAISLIFEYDSAYRYRFQDVIVELGEVNTENILRLFDILSARDYDVMKVKWQKIKKFTKILFIISPKIKNEVISILKKLNIKELEMSIEDRYWTEQFRGTYRYGGIDSNGNKIGG